MYFLFLGNIGKFLIVFPIQFSFDLEIEDYDFSFFEVMPSNGSNHL